MQPLPRTCVGINHGHDVASMAWKLHAIEQAVTGTTLPSIPVVNEKSRDRKFLNEDGTREGGRA